MKIVLASPLYPPDIAEPAPYIKELARQLAAAHDVTLVVYSNAPERVPGVRILPVRKNMPLPVRLLYFFFTLLRAARGADLLYIENGASVELPAGLVARIMRKPLILHIGDAKAHSRARGIRKSIERFAARGGRVLAETPLPRPEILPFEPRPEGALVEHEQSWAAHMRTLAELFK